MKDKKYSEEIAQIMKDQFSRYHNQLNVIGGLMQLDKYDKAFNYLQESSKKNRQEISIWVIKNIETSLLLYRKYNTAMNKGITVEFDIQTTLDKIDMRLNNLNTMLSNIIDYALDELDQCNEKEKNLYIDISEMNKEYMLAIGHSFPKSAPEVNEEINIKQVLKKVEKIVLKNKGRVTFERYEEVGTVITVFVPKKI